jgi:uncharacterized NAD(P)/FAD-binding protein YdhS
MKQPDCPECEKLSAVSKESNRLGEFLDWLEHEKGFVIAEWDKEDAYKDNNLYPTHIPYNTLLAEYFNIDLNKVEKERSVLLEYIRKNNT